ncbi:MAG TPA: acetyl/propionyl/methylcrotonyl-CoA carboxylase subunit alpha [Alphaproteobacteria bacterium]|nr:acetyl/propionyl/methylcrotonyl-CoA carboxylase subunit alpha [Alphaproteobacteria bacterium]
MFKKILIANRGEIACRIAKTCKKMGIATIGIYSDVDKNSMHLQYVDEAVNIGPADSSKSYLNIENIIKAAKEKKADAVHPGYGFLSENAEFSKALEKAKIIFIGPSIEAIQSMGDKIISKRIAKKAGVNIIPGVDGAIKNVEDAIKAAKEIGYPVMVKASAGGGGKGMRVAKDKKELISGFQSAKNEAKKSFGDDRVFIEKFIVGPRHIEIQILADEYGNMVYLGERECSVQRRHQKVIEESPSSLVDEDMRKEMGEQALLLAKAVNYSSAGTVEFVASNDKSFYFLEMNTRLQVEHPVTELVTGIDLVEKMINISAKKPLGLVQSDIKLNGWSVEARIYAENPIRNFAPSIGRLRKFIPPTHEDMSIRLDSGVQEGGEISMYYDPMIAKLISYGEDRIDACNKLSTALDAFVIKGVSTNIPFVNSVLTNKKFLSGNITTAFLEEEYPTGYTGLLKSKSKLFLISITSLAMEAIEIKRKSKLTKGNYVVTTAKHYFELKYEIISNDINNLFKIKVEHNSKLYEVAVSWNIGDPILQITLDAETFLMQVSKSLSKYNICHAGFDVQSKVTECEIFNLSKLIPRKVKNTLSKTLISPMPGQVVKVCVSENQKVNLGEDLIILDAMKMENILKADKDIIVKKINVKAGDIVSVDQELITFA